MRLIERKQLAFTSPEQADEFVEALSDLEFVVTFTVGHLVTIKVFAPEEA